MAEAPTPPSVRDIVEIAASFGMTLTEAEAEAYRGMMAGAFKVFAWMDAQETFKPPVRYPRDRGFRPERSDNPYNAWFWRCTIEGAAGGPLAGMRAGIKDTISVAGLPMRNASSHLEGFVADVDATAVTRLLDAGATIVGKTTVNDGLGGAIEGNDVFATVRNPRKPSHAPGGSSNGSAAALAAGDIELALGGDQGGSIRVPAAWSGVVGLKPTYGLVPYTGVVTVEMTLDHIGPMANSVEDCARMLSAIAGPDPLDPRQRGVAPATTDYAAAIGEGVRGTRIGVIKEGFGQAEWEDLGLPGSEEVVDAKVRAALAELEKRGAVVEEVSIPMHLDGVRIFYGFYTEGAAEFMIKGNFTGTNWMGFYNQTLAETYGAAWRARPDELSVAFKSILLLGEYLGRTTHGRYYAKGQHLRMALGRAYDKVFESYDVLALPTTPFRATPIPEPGCGIAETAAFAMRMIGNTCQFGATGHPAISVPCGVADDLPIGLQLVGRHLDEATVLRVADAFERVGDWQSM